MSVFIINEELHGAAIAPTSTDLGVDDETYIGQLHEALALAYPSVQWCTLDEHNLLVRGNGWDDVSDQVSIDALISLTPDELQIAIDTMRAAKEA